VSFLRQIICLKNTTLADCTHYTESPSYDYTQWKLSKCAYCAALLELPSLWRRQVGSVFECTVGMLVYHHQH